MIRNDGIWKECGIEGLKYLSKKMLLILKNKDERTTMQLSTVLRVENHY
jgi:hypothetical protein